MRPRHGPATSPAPDPLGRPFSLIAFDWDGTAVLDREEETTRLRLRIERLLERGVRLAIVTGTNFGNIDRQSARAIRSPHKSGLLVLTNRGSEVYGFDSEGAPILIWKREASPTEERLLTIAAERTREVLTRRTGLEIAVIEDRLNRRKIDLIPTMEWADPPKSRIAELTDAVEKRLRDAGLDGGLREAYSIAEEAARSVGLEGARITSDVKHIEIGLTDKADSVHWLLREVALPAGIGDSEILIVGDEFGPVAGFAGSDAKLIIPEARGITYLSVGPEPNGVPPGVLAVGGGPATFLDLLEEQARLHNTFAAFSNQLPIEPTVESDWIIVEEGFDLDREAEVEALFTVGNGYLGSRGSLAERSSLSSPATYIAGVYADPAIPGTVPGLAHGPDWTELTGYIDGDPVLLEGSDPLEHRRILDLRQGILWREWRHQDSAGRTTMIRALRLASLADRHLLMQIVLLIPENHESRLSLTAQIKEAGGATDPSLPLWVVDTPSTGGGSTLLLEAIGSGVRVALATSTTIRTPPDEPFLCSRTAAPLKSSAGEIHESWEGHVRPGEVYRLDRLVSVHTTREVAAPDQEALRHLGVVEARGTDRLLLDHTLAWSKRWPHAAIEIEGDQSAARALHFAAYHLISAADPDDERVSVGARALTGDAYKGHVFWDTEIFMLPFYTLTHPRSARSILDFRYHTLPQAREKARLYGYRGALFAWESTVDGLEATPTVATAPDGTMTRILSGEQEHHISADIAYAVWQYWQFTGDDEFFVDRGAEIILETARFWASRGQFEDDGLFHFKDLIGPDEYHEDVDDNAFTNLMAQWNLGRGVETARYLQRYWPDQWGALGERIGLGPDEPDSWMRIADRIYTGFDSATGLFEQFAGFHHLDPIDLGAYEPRTIPMDIILGRERVQRSDVIKQADVVLLIYLLWDRFSPEVRAANFRYYEPRCGHGSSLSPGIHGLMAARLGYLDLAEHYFRKTAEIDLADNMGNAARGVHIGALGSLWQMAVLGYGGLYPRGSGDLTGSGHPVFDPRPLPGWEWMRYRIWWRGRSLAVEIDSTEGLFEVRLEEGDPVEIELRGHPPQQIRMSGPPARARLQDRQGDSVSIRRH